MANPFLLTRVLLRFDTQSDDLLGELSAAARTPDGSLWVGSDEWLSVERLTPLESHVFGDHQPFFLGDFVELFNHEDEIDIEGMDYADHYLWVTGSHSTKRKKPKGKKPETDMERLTTIKTDRNRYLLARVPVLGGGLVKSATYSDDTQTRLSAVCLQKTADANVLIDALREDPHLGPFLTFPLPSKENGFDIEGLAVYQDRIFLGFRGPVLRGWAVILEIVIEETAPGVLTLKEIGTAGRHYRKHFVYLNGLGVRELCLQGEDLLILAGPSLDTEGAMRVFRMKSVLEYTEDSLTDQDAKALEVVFDLPFTIGKDHAEGLVLFPCLGQQNALLVVYDSPDDARRPEKNAVYADAFRL